MASDIEKDLSSFKWCSMSNENRSNGPIVVSKNQKNWQRMEGRNKGYWHSQE